MAAPSCAGYYLHWISSWLISLGISVDAQGRGVVSKFVARVLARAWQSRRMGFLSRIGGAVFARPALIGALWASLVSIPKVSAEVGLLLGGVKRELVMESCGRNWALEAGACFVGNSRNLVVDPTLDHDVMRAQELITDYTGPRLCEWLDKTYAQHMAQQAAWEAAHANSKSRVSAFNVIGRLKKAIASFPIFKVKVTVRYLDVWHDDRWGNPLPWILAKFEYIIPENGYGLFSHIYRVFSMSPSSGTAALVHLLLNPPPTFNQHVDLGKEKASILQAIAGGTGIGHTLLSWDKDSAVAKAFELGQIIYALAKGEMRMKFAIGDFWLKGTSCYILSRLAVTSVVNGVSLCQFVADRGSKGLWALYKAEKQKSVTLDITGVDFFNYRRPTFEAVVTEGMLIAGLNDVPVVLELVTDPTVIPNYVGTVRAARKVRWASSLFNFFIFALDKGLIVYDTYRKTSSRRAPEQSG